MNNPNSPDSYRDTALNIKCTGFSPQSLIPSNLFLSLIAFSSFPLLSLNSFLRLPWEHVWARPDKNILINSLGPKARFSFLNKSVLKKGLGFRRRKKKACTHTHGGRTEPCVQLSLFQQYPKIKILPKARSQIAPFGKSAWHSTTPFLQAHTHSYSHTAILFPSATS